MGAVKKITFISLLSAAILGTIKQMSTKKRCYGLSIKRKHMWKMKQKQISMMFKAILKLFKAKRETKNVWKKMFQSA